MELKVWVEGIQRIVCGVTDVTTCQDVVYALAHATGKTGRFTLMERWRNSERLLAPHEHPLKILLKWGEYASDVQFILQRTALEPKPSSSDFRGHDPGHKLHPQHGATSQLPPQQQQHPHHQRAPLQQSNLVSGVPPRVSHHKTPPSLEPSPRSTPQSPLQSRGDIKKSLTFSGGHSSHLVAPPPLHDGASSSSPESKKDDGRRREPGVAMTTAEDLTDSPSVVHENNNNMRSSLTRPSDERGNSSPLPPPPPPSSTQASKQQQQQQQQQQPPPPPAPLPNHHTPHQHHHNLLHHNNDLNNSHNDDDDDNQNDADETRLNRENRDTSSGDINDNMIPSTKSSSTLPAFKKEGSPFSSSPLGGSGGEGEKNMVQSIIKQLVKNSNSSSGGGKETPPPSNNHHSTSTEEVVVDAYYRDLVRLVNEQREKISAQQIDLTKYEAEIAFTEGRWREEESRLNYLQQEIQRLESIPDKQVDMTLYSDLEEQLAAAKQSETDSEEQLASLRQKMASCQQQLDKIKARVGSIQEALVEEEERRRKAEKEEETRIEEEDQESEAILREIEKLQAAVAQSNEQADAMMELSRQLGQEILEAESVLEEKRRAIECLKQAMRDANLEALSMTPPDETKAPSDTKTGTNRRMVGSPRQLETAVPTSKNPHGVWV